MISTELLLQLYERTQRAIDKQTDGLTHEDSLLQLPFRGNCMNWVLGHILVYRDRVLKLLEEDLHLSESESRMYARESPPIADSDPAITLERLLAALEESQEQIAAALGNASSERMDTKVEEGKDDTVREWIEFLQWHETYHVGQLEILRQLAGKDDAII